MRSLSTVKMGEISKSKWEKAVRNLITFKYAFQLYTDSVMLVNCTQIDTTAGKLDEPNTLLKSKTIYCLTLRFREIRIKKEFPE